MQSETRQKLARQGGRTKSPRGISGYACGLFVRPTKHGEAFHALQILMNSSVIPLQVRAIRIGHLDVNDLSHGRSLRIVNVNDLIVRSATTVIATLFI